MRPKHALLIQFSFINGLNKTPWQWLNIMICNKRRYCFIYRGSNLYIGPKFNLKGTNFNMISKIQIYNESKKFLNWYPMISLSEWAWHSSENVAIQWEDYKAR